MFGKHMKSLEFLKKVMHNPYMNVHAGFVSASKVFSSHLNPLNKSLCFPMIHTWFIYFGVAK